MHAMKTLRVVFVLLLLLAGSSSACQNSETRKPNEPQGSSLEETDRESGQEGIQGLAYYFHVQMSVSSGTGKQSEDRRAFVMIGDSGNILQEGMFVIIDEDLMDREMKASFAGLKNGDPVLFYYSRVGASEPPVIYPLHVEKTTVTFDFSIEEAEAVIRSNRYEIKK